MILGWRVPGQDWTLIPRKYLASGDVCQARYRTDFLPAIYMLLMGD
jgi:hypothetical protein